MGFSGLLKNHLHQQTEGFSHATSWWVPQVGCVSLLCVYCLFRVSTNYLFVGEFCVLHTGTSDPSFEFLFCFFLEILHETFKVRLVAPSFLIYLFPKFIQGGRMHFCINVGVSGLGYHLVWDLRHGGGRKHTGKNSCWELFLKAVLSRLMDHLASNCNEPTIREMVTYFCLFLLHKLRNQGNIMEQSMGQNSTTQAEPH